MKTSHISLIIWVVKFRGGSASVDALFPTFLGSRCRRNA